MEYYSIELAAERIDDSRTRDYFNEALSSYINGNYRSAVVMLWSVVVCDLVYKLQRLKELYNDATAEAILEEIEHQQRANPRSPDWELSLIQAVRDRTELIDNAEYQSLEHIQAQRHLSAHPVLSNVDLLFSPNRDTVRALMRNALDCVLMKPPVLSRRITEDFVVDLASKQELFVDDASLRRYLEAKYLRNLRPTVENRLFRDLWKFVFRLNNDDAERNRNINYRALCIIFDRRRAELRDYIATQPDYFSEVSNGSSQLQHLIEFLNRYPTVYRQLTDAALVPLHNYANQDIAIFAGAFFLSDNVCSHLRELRDRVKEQAEFYTNWEPSFPSEESWEQLVTLAEEAACTSLAVDIAVALHSKSGNFDSANTSFSRFIQPYLELFNETHLENLLIGIELNDQTYRRRRASYDYQELFQRCADILPEDFDYERYPNFYDLIRRLIDPEFEEDDMPSGDVKHNA